MTTLFIHELKIDTTIGVYAWEQAIKQPLVFDLEFSVDSTAAAATDDIKHAVDYAALTERVTQFVSASRCQLIETLAHRVVELLVTEFNLTDLRLRLTKPGAIKNAKAVSIVVNYAQSTVT